MSDQSGISWTDATWNPVTGCTPVSPGCAKCYAMRMTRRLEGIGQSKYAGLTNGKHFNGTVRCHDDLLDVPLRWRKPRMVFVCSMSDLFHESVPFKFIDAVFAVMALSPRHTFQVLTKRPERMAEYMTRREVLPGSFSRKAGAKYKTPCDRGYYIAREIAPEHPTELVWPLPNVWLGTSAEDQQRFDERVEHLQHCPAAVRFVSLEPLLGPIDLKRMDCSAWETTTIVDVLRNQIVEDSELDTPCEGDGNIDWVIVGGESGPGYRRMNHEWLRRIVDDCAAAHVPVFVKQDSGPRSGITETIPGGYMVQQRPERGA